MKASESLSQSPTKLLSNALTVTGGPMKASEVIENALKEIRNNTYLAGLDEFLNSMFPFAEAADLVYEDICKNGFYDKNSVTWADTPRDSALEAEYYPWFTNTAEKIKETYLKLFRGKAITFHNKWKVNPNKAPANLSDIGSIVRPDIVNVVQSWEELELEELPQKYEQELLEKQSALTKARGNATKEKAEKAALLKKLAVWWSRINVVVEIKRSTPSSPLQHLGQLVGYIQHVLGEQLDRRSAIGLLFCKNELAVWHADRSGILGTGEAFNVHLHPKKFIQVILGCSFGKPSTLGYDTSMKLWLPKSKVTLPSYHADVTTEDFQRSNLEKNWVISMPAPGDSSHREEFLTINAISTTRANNISGRATVVWVAMKYGDRGKKNHKVYVLKQCWRPVGTPAEWTLIPDGVNDITRVYTYEDVQEEENQEINTVECLRHGLGHTVPKPPPDNPEKVEAQLNQADKVETSELKTIVFTLLGKEMEIKRTIPIPRVLSRIVMEDYGWPIHHFRDLHELLSILKQVVLAQKSLYFEHRTLQRDISVGNILIVPSEPNHPSQATHAYLIDFDYAKRVEGTIPSTLGSLNKINGPWLDQLFLEQMRVQLRIHDQLNVAPQLDRVLAVYLNPFQGYLPEAIEAFGLQERPELTPADLGLLSESEQLPDFQSSTAQSRERSATIPFASCEVLLGQKMFAYCLPRPLPNHADYADFNAHIRRREKNVELHHDAVHDVEALFWLITFICLTRSGPGGKRREDSGEDQNHPKPSISTHELCHRLFVGTEREGIATTKYTILLHETDDVTCHFAPYFSPIKGLWVQWRNLLRFAHTHPIFECIHDSVLAAIDIAMKEVERLPETLPQEVMEVDKKRKEQLHFFSNFLSDMEVGTQPSITCHDLSPGKSTNFTAEQTRGADGQERPAKIARLDLRASQ